MLNPDFRDMLSALSAEKAEYLVVGAYALAAHGLPRATGDLDLWIRSSEENAEAVWRALQRFGTLAPGIDKKDLRNPGTVIQIGVQPRRIDLLTTIDGVRFSEAWLQRLEIELDGIRVPVLSRADLIRNKKAAGRPKDLADLETLEDAGGAPSQ